MRILRQLFEFTDNRTGIQELTKEALYENIPGGSKWRYISGSMLVFAFVTQMITGTFLAMSYSPSSTTAWASVYYIQNELSGGWLLRGIHHYMAQAMVVLLPIHMLQVVLEKAYVKPREFNYWLGLVLMLITFGLGLTGYLLPWDQKGYWATKVATNLMTLPPGGAAMQKMVVGGTEYGNLTLTRFFALHVLVLPGAIIGFLVLHLALFRKHGITAHSSDKRGDEYFWPKQVLKDAVGCAILFALIFWIAIAREGAELGPPAEPTKAFDAARPEWYFLFLFQLLKKFQSEVVGAIVVPGLIFGFFFIMPLIAKFRPRHLFNGHLINVSVMGLLFLGAGYLTFEAMQEDNYTLSEERLAEVRESSDPSDKVELEKHDKAARFHRDKEAAERDYNRIAALIDYQGIPVAGPLELLRNDPEIMGARLFKAKCASCHAYDDPSTEGIELGEFAGPNMPEGWDAESGSDFGAPNLYGFGSVNWIKNVLTPEKIKSVDNFGATAHRAGSMVDFVENGLNGDFDDQITKIAKALSAEAGLVYEPLTDEVDAIAEGNELIQNGDWNDYGTACTDCHSYKENEEIGGGPDLTGYASADWIRQMISDPSHSSMYGYDGADNNDRMPAFKEFLTEKEIDLLVQFIRQDMKNLNR